MENYTLFIFILILGKISCQCDTFFTSIFQNLQQNSSNFTAIQQNFINFSGKFISDLGDYSSCTSISSMSYYMMEVTSKIVTFIGLCVPNFCDSQDLQKYFQPQDYFPQWANTNVTDYVETSSFMPTKNFWFYLALGVFTMLILANLTFSLTIAVTMKSHKKTEPLLENSIESNELDKKLKVSNLRTFISCFDIFSNVRDFFEYKTRVGHDENLEVFSFWRCTSFMWVVAGHTAYADFQNSQQGDFFSFQISEQTAILLGGTYAVDIFLFIGGFVAAWTLISKLKKLKRSFKNFGLIYLNRWLRIWPSYMIAILIFWQIAPQFISGPLSYEMILQQQYCSANVWQNALFIDNFLNDDTSSGCFGWGWYLAVDMQLFLFVPWIIWSYIENPMRTKKILWILTALGTVIFTILQLELVLFAYYFPFARMPPYTLGLILGLEYVEAQNNSDDQKAGFYKKLKFAFGKDYKYALVYLIGSLILINLFAISNLSLLSSQISPILRPSYILVLTLLLVACFEDKFPRLKNFFKAPLFKVMSKLTFTGYLLQLIFIMFYFYSQTSLGVFSGWQMLGNILLMIAASFVGAFVLHILVEVPIAQIVKNFLRSR